MKEDEENGEQIYRTETKENRDFVSQMFQMSRQWSALA